jgi:hypothetical protein
MHWTRRTRLGIRTVARNLTRVQAEARRRQDRRSGKSRKLAEQPGDDERAQPHPEHLV